MRKFLLIVVAAVLAGAMPAHALHSDRTVEQWYEARYICKMGEDRDGNHVLEPDHGAICHALETLSVKLLEDDYCWNSSEQEWLSEDQTDSSCRPSD